MDQSNYQRPCTLVVRKKTRPPVKAPYTFPSPSQPTLELAKTIQKTCPLLGDCTRHTPSDNGLTGTVAACQVRRTFSRRTPGRSSSTRRWKRGLAGGGEACRSKMAQRLWPTCPALKGVRLQPGRGHPGHAPPSTPSLVQLQALTLCILTATLCNDAYYPHLTAG